MAVLKKEIKRELLVFHCEEFSHKAIDELIEFLKQSSESAHKMGNMILLDYVKYKFLTNYFVIGINYGGSVYDYEIREGKYYYFKGDALIEVKDLDKVKL